MLKIHRILLISDASSTCFVNKFWFPQISWKYCCYTVTSGIFQISWSNLLAVQWISTFSWNSKRFSKNKKRITTTTTTNMPLLELRQYKNDWIAWRNFFCFEIGALFHSPVCTVSLKARQFQNKQISSSRSYIVFTKESKGEWPSLGRYFQNCSFLPANVYILWRQKIVS